ncbi:MAG TPA: galactokinase [Syntrophomonas sp.]|nr:galactokinase [Syntrophomonas sp.]
MTYHELVDQFIKIYGGSKDGIRLFEAPGRINLIGEHIDYNGGHVFPAALDMINVVVARPNRTQTLNLAATDLPDRVGADLNTLESYRNLRWGSYQYGVAYMLQQSGYKVAGCDLLYHSTLPFGAGLSSSASIEVATAIALTKLGGREDLDRKEIALLCQRAENDYVGMNCGIMDQFTVAMARKGYAIFLDCSTLEYRYVPLELDNYTIVITNTNAPHKLTESQYNQRRSECEQALKIINGNGGNYPYLCSIKIEELESFKRFFSKQEQVLYQRARHCVTEEARTVASLVALEKGDITAFGELLNEANISMRVDYEATGRELDIVFDIAQQIDGVIGSRVTGGGFGGCSISIVEKTKVEEFMRIMAEVYTRRIGYAPAFYQSNAGDGAKEVIAWQ